MSDLGADVAAYEAARGGDSKRWGPLAWRLLHDTVDSLPCAPCREEGRLLVSAMHDAVNDHLGKPVRDPRALCVAAAQIGAVAQKHDSCHLDRFIRCGRGFE